MEQELKAKWLEMSVREVSAQCQLAKTAYKIMSGASDTDTAFSAIQAFLSHCANASKMLQAEQEPRQLNDVQLNWRAVYRWLQSMGLFRPKPTIGDMLGISKSSVLHQQGREFRNNLEHYEQRLFAWLSKYGPRVNIGDYNVMPKSAIRGRAGVRFLFVRNLEPLTHVFTFVDKDLDLEQLLQEIERTKSAAGVWLGEHYRH